MLVKVHAGDDDVEGEQNGDSVEELDQVDDFAGVGRPQQIGLAQRVFAVACCR